MRGKKRRKSLIYMTCLLTWVFLLKSSPAQESMAPLSPLDSLENKLYQTSGKEKLYLLLELCQFTIFRNPEKTLDFAEQGLALARELGHDSILINMAQMIGNAYIYSDKYTSALDAYHKALNIADSLGALKPTGSILNNIGATYFKMNNLAQANEYFKKALKIEEMEKDSFRIANISTNVGTIHILLGTLDSVTQHYLKALRIYQKLNDQNGMSNLYTNLGEYHLKTQNLDSAFWYINQAKIIFKEADNTYGLAKANLNLASIYSNLNQDKKAIALSLEALELARNFKSREVILESSRYLAELYKKTNNPEKAFQYYELHIEEKDSLFDDQLASQIAELQTKYETQAKITENELLKETLALKELENERQKQIRNRILLTAIALILFIFILFRLNRLRKLQNEKIMEKSHELEMANEKLEELNATKDKFFSIIAHEIKNPFFNVLGFSNLALTKWDAHDREKLKKYMSHIYDSAKSGAALLENLLEWSRSQTGSIKYHPETIKLKFVLHEVYSTLSTSLTEKKLILKEEINDDFEVYADEQMLKTILRNLLSNAVKFSYPNNEIIIRASKNNHFNDISIVDHGTGIEEKNINNLFKVERTISTAGTKNERGTGLGLLICKEFIDIHGGNILAESKIGEGSTFTIKLPDHKNGHSAV